MGHDRFWRGRGGGGEAASRCRRRSAKSDAAVREAEGDDCRLEVEDDQRKLGRWAKCVVGPNCWLPVKKI
jgi:hypothetical protein